MIDAVMRTCGADVAAIQDEAVVDIFPVFFGNEHLEVFGNLLQVIMVGKIESFGKTLHMSVCRNAFPYIV